MKKKNEQRKKFVPPILEEIRASNGPVTYPGAYNTVPKKTAEKKNITIRSY